MDCLSSSSHHRTHASASERSLSLSLSLCFSSHTPLFPPPPSCDREKRGAQSGWEGSFRSCPQREDAPATPRLWRQAKRAPDSTPPGSCETAKLLMRRGACASGVACDLVQHILGGGRWRWVGGGITLVLLQLQATQSMPRGEG
jgi:hypothetical protein